MIKIIMHFSNYNKLMHRFRKVQTSVWFSFIFDTFLWSEQWITYYTTHNVPKLLSVQ